MYVCMLLGMFGPPVASFKWEGLHRRSSSPLPPPNEKSPTATFGYAQVARLSSHPPRLVGLCCPTAQLFRLRKKEKSPEMLCCFAFVILLRDEG